MNFAAAIAATIVGVQAIKLQDNPDYRQSTTTTYEDLNSGYNTTYVWEDYHNDGTSYTSAWMDNTEAPEGDHISYWKYSDGEHTSERVTVQDGATNKRYYSDAAEGELLEDWYVYDENW